MLSSDSRSAAGAMCRHPYSPVRERPDRRGDPSGPRRQRFAADISRRYPPFCPGRRARVQAAGKKRLKEAENGVSPANIRPWGACPPSRVREKHASHASVGADNIVPCVLRICNAEVTVLPPASLFPYITATPALGRRSVIATPPLFLEICCLCCVRPWAGDTGKLPFSIRLFPVPGRRRRRDKCCLRGEALTCLEPLRHPHSGCIIPRFINIGIIS